MYTQYIADQVESLAGLIDQLKDKVDQGESYCVGTLKYQQGRLRSIEGALDTLTLAELQQAVRFVEDQHSCLVFLKDGTTRSFNAIPPRRMKLKKKYC